VLKLGGGDHRKFDRVGYMIGLVAGYVTCKKATRFYHTKPLPQQSHALGYKHDSSVANTT
jgi:hypothetical protein